MEKEEGVRGKKGRQKQTNRKGGGWRVRKGKKNEWGETDRQIKEGRWGKEKRWHGGKGGD